MKSNCTKILLFFLIVALFLTSATACSSESNLVVDGTVFVDEVKKRDVGNTLSYNGNVVSDINAEIYSSVVGLVESVSVKKGDKVKKGDIICKISTDEIESQIEELEITVKNEDSINNLEIEQAEKTLKNAKQTQSLTLKQLNSEIESAQNEYNTAKSNYEKYLKLYNEEISNKESYEKELAELENSEEDIEELTKNIENATSLAENYKEMYIQYNSSLLELKSAITSAQDNYDTAVIEQDSAVEQAQYELDKLKSSSSGENSEKLEDLKKQLDDYVIYATSDGVVSSLDVTQGLSIDDISIPVATISNENTTNIIIYVSDADIFDIKTDMTAKISVSGNSKLTAVGTVTKVSSVKDVENNGYKTVISVENSDALKIGMSVKVSIFSLIEKNVLSLNSEALISYGENEYKVYVLQKNDDGTYILVQKIIKCEWLNSEYVKFPSDFDILNEGDYVVAEPSYYEEGFIVSDIEVLDEE